MSRSSRKRERQREAGPPLSPLPPPVKEAPGVWRYALPALCLLYLIFAFLHAQFASVGATGYQNAPDEAAHIAFVQRVAQGGLPLPPENLAKELGFTVWQANPGPFDYEWHQPPLYYAIVALVYPLGNLAMRCVSIAFGLISILLIYRAARHLFPDEPLLCTLAAGFAALLPGHIAITSTVNNDSLLEAGFSAAILLLFAALHSGFSLWRAGWLGLILGATILTKVTGLLLLPVLLFALLLMWRSGEKPGHLIRGTVWCLGIALLVCGWWFVRNKILYQAWLPLDAFHRAFEGTAQATVWAGRMGGWESYWMLVGQWSFQSFWAVYGTRETAANGLPVFLPERVYLFYVLITLCAFAGLVRSHFRKSEMTQAQLYQLWILFFTFGLVLCSFIGFLTRYFQTQGRYLYPAMLPIAILFSVGWRAILPTRYLALATGFLLTLFSAMCLIFLRYAVL